MQLDVNEFTYTLPPERIAQYPLAERDHSKLLVYDKGVIAHQKFYNIAEFLPEKSSLFFNETKVIPARLHFYKATGAAIEIFLLNPVKPSVLLIESMQAYHSCTWKCVIGNLKRWTNQPLLKNINGITLEALLVKREEGIVQFSWGSSHTFAEILGFIGETPLPPYLKRKVEDADKERYQTVYSSQEGAVAAPTAGLHFTPSVFELLKKKNIRTSFLTLHVSAGTFQPIKAQNAFEHTMHKEQLVVSRQNVEALLKSTFVTAVGTTSLRTLESLYWFGVKLWKNPQATFEITQEEIYIPQRLPSPLESLRAILIYMDQHKKETLIGETSIFIVPGYVFKICHALITNFHQPRSTLILLIASFIGDDWKKVYEEALMNDYRFLSYGDSSLLIGKFEN